MCLRHNLRLDPVAARPPAFPHPPDLSKQRHSHPQRPDNRRHNDIHPRNVRRRAREVQPQPAVDDPHRDADPPDRQVHVLSLIHI